MATDSVTISDGKHILYSSSLDVDLVEKLFQQSKDFLTVSIRLLQSGIL